MKRGRQRKAAVHNFTFAGYGLSTPTEPLPSARCKCGHMKAAHHRGHGLCLNCEAQRQHCPFYQERTQ